MELSQDIFDRFWSKVEKTDTCWLWTAAKTSDGYGAFNRPVDGKLRMIRAHRFAWIITHGNPTKPEFHHLCNTRLCVRPDHLQEVTRKEHMSLTPGTYGYKWKHRTHCQNGHELTPDNCTPASLKRGFRKCRICNAANVKRWQQENLEKFREATRRYREKNHAVLVEKNREYNRTVRGCKPRQPQQPATGL